MEVTRTIVNLLEADSALATGLTPRAQQAAALSLDVRVRHAEPGEWRPEELGLGADSLGLLVTRGVVARCVQINHRGAAELLGSGDLLRPWHHNEPPFATRWKVLDRLSFAVLDGEATRRIARYPRVLLTLIDRELERSRRMTERCATAQLACAEERLRVELGRLAQRWGTPVRGGTALPLSLTHEILGYLIGTRRQTVTTALSEMTRTGKIAPLQCSGWLLLRDGDPSASPSPGRDQSSSAGRAAACARR